jgi:TIR domain-containing protein
LIVTIDPEESFQFDVALSFAGEDRQYVDHIADSLRSKGVRVFYDRYEQATLWGKDLYEHLDYVYQRAARFYVLFASEHYARKVWTTHERKSAQARALRENEEYILPVRFDDTEIPGIRSTVGYIDARQTTAEQLVDLVLQKVGQPPKDTPVAAAARTPRTTEQEHQLLTQRPTGWEYAYLAGLLMKGKKSLESKWRDHQLGYVRKAGPALSDAEVPDFINGALRELAGIAGNIERIFDAKAQERAFGPPGVPGDPVEIEHMAGRAVELYASLLDWSANIRGTPVSHEFTRLFELLAQYPDGPIREMRAFFYKCVDEVDKLPDRLAEDSDEPIAMRVEVIFYIDKRLRREYDRESKRLRRRGLLG